MCASVVGYSVARSNTIDDDTYTSRSTRSSSAAVEDAVVEARVHLEQRERVAVEVADAADDRGEVDHVRAAGERRVRPPRGRAGRRSRPRTTRASTGARSRWSATRTSQPGSASSRRTTAAPIVPAPPVTRTRLTPCAGGARGLPAAARRRRRRPGPSRSRSRGPRAARRRGHLRGRMPLELGVVGGDHDGVGAGERGLERLAGDRHVRVVAGHMGQLALEQPDRA